MTFSRDVAPILFAACARCHRPEGVAPFSLLTYSDAVDHAAAIVAATRSRRMPPWKPEPGYGRFADEQRLTTAEIATLERWLEAGMPEGDRGDLPPPPKWSGAWQLGTPDLVLQPEAYTLHAAGGDVYRNFALPIELPGRRYVRAWEFLAGSPAVHHATIEIDPARAARRLDAQDPEPGYEGLIPHSAMSPDGFFLGWLPGHGPNVAPAGMAWPLDPNTDLVMMLHLRPTGRDVLIRPRLGLYFSEAPPRLEPVLVRLTRQNLDIPAGARDYVARDSFTLAADVDLYTIQPHAHHLAQEIKSVATLPDGTRKWLIYIRQWEFDWQGVYRYARPEFLPAGTTISMEYRYDNSAANPHNPNRPPVRVTYGERTTDEMAELWLQVVPRRAADRPRLAAAVRAKVVREKIVGLEKRLESEPDDAALHDDAALLYAETGRLDRTADHFAATARLRPRSAAAQYNLGNALFRLGRRGEAIEHFERALALDPAYAPAYDALGVALYTGGAVQAAIERYMTAIALDPADADAHHHLAVALTAAGDLPRAAAEYRTVLALDPGRPDVKAALAAVERRLTLQDGSGR